MAEVHIDPRAVAEYVDDPDGPVAHALEDVGFIIANSARGLARRRTGALAGSIGSRISWADDGAIYLDVSGLWRGLFLQPVHVWKTETMHARYPYFDESEAEIESYTGGG